MKHSARMSNITVKKMVKEAVVVSFEVLVPNLSVGTKIHEKSIGKTHIKDVI